MSKLPKVKASPTWYERIILNFLDSSRFRVVYDIGVGPKTEYLTIKNAFPEVAFFGLEANPETYLEVELKFPGIVLPLAVSVDGQPVRYFVHNKNVMASGLIPYDNENKGESFEVGSITLDKFDARFGCPSGILLWMDIEGYELKALQSGRELLKSGRVDLLNLEVRSRWNGKEEGCTEEAIDDYLSQFGYQKVFVYNHYQESRHHDAIYVRDLVNLPDSAQSFIGAYRAAISAADNREGQLDLALGLVDSLIAIQELNDKIAYLRAQLASRA